MNANLTAKKGGSMIKEYSHERELMDENKQKSRIAEYIRLCSIPAVQENIRKGMGPIRNIKRLKAENKRLRRDFNAKHDCP
jgi:type IV secretory pathway component VirB8